MTVNVVGYGDEVALQAVGIDCQIGILRQVHLITGDETIQLRRQPGFADVGQPDWAAVENSDVALTGGQAGAHLLDAVLLVAGHDDVLGLECGVQLVEAINESLLHGVKAAAAVGRREPLRHLDFRRFGLFRGRRGFLLHLLFFSGGRCDGAAGCQRQQGTCAGQSREDAPAAESEFFCFHPMTPFGWSYIDAMYVPGVRNLAANAGGLADARADPGWRGDSYGWVCV